MKPKVKVLKQRNGGTFNDIYELVKATTKALSDMETRKLILDGLEVAGLVPWDPTKHTKSPDRQLATSVMATQSRKNIAAHVVNLLSSTEPDDDDDAAMEGNRVMEIVRFATPPLRKREAIALLDKRQRALSEKQMATNRDEEEATRAIRFAFKAAREGDMTERMALKRVRHMVENNETSSRAAATVVGLELSKALSLDRDEQKMVDVVHTETRGNKRRRKSLSIRLSGNMIRRADSVHITGQAAQAVLAAESLKKAAKEADDAYKFRQGQAAIKTLEDQIKQHLQATHFNGGPSPPKIAAKSAKAWLKQIVAESQGKADELAQKATRLTNVTVEQGFRSKFWEAPELFGSQLYLRACIL
jgi:hypothetical protein